MSGDSLDPVDMDAALDAWDAGGRAAPTRCGCPTVRIADARGDLKRGVELRAGEENADLHSMAGDSGERAGCEPTADAGQTCSFPMSKEWGAFPLSVEPCGPSG